MKENTNMLSVNEVSKLPIIKNLVYRFVAIISQPAIKNNILKKAHNTYL